MEDVIFLGKTSKLARGLRQFWSTEPSAVINPSWYARGKQPDGAERARCVVALWGVTHGNEAELAGNAQLAREAVALARSMGARRVVHLSSAAVYGAQEGPIREDAPLLGHGAYARAKIDMERAIADEQAQGGLQNVILRIANVAGCDALFRSLSTQSTIMLDRFEDGRGPDRSYIAIPELAASLEALVSGKAPFVLNVAARHCTAMEDIAKAAGAAVTWRDAPVSALQRVQLDVTRLERLVSFASSAADPAHLVASWRAYGGWV